MPSRIATGTKNSNTLKIICKNVAQNGQKCNAPKRAPNINGQQATKATMIIAEGGFIRCFGRLFWIKEIR